MPDHVTDADIVIHADGLGKTYRLYKSPLAQFMDAMGFGALLSKASRGVDFTALRDVSLTIHRGERVGIVGRNGAGKSTLLKLIAGRIAPSQGSITCHGAVHTLMDLGLGFHPDFSGGENIRSALVYNGLPDSEIESTVAEIIDFCELGDFINQPLSTYSAGMRVRLHFATATAIRPDVLIVDEVLGAGDQYFAARSAERMRKLAGSGCSLLLVSHSLQQVIEYCERAIWIERGRIVMEGSTLAVVKAYEEFVQRLAHVHRSRPEMSVIENVAETEELLAAVLANNEASGEGGVHVTDGGVSRWQTSNRLRVDEQWFSVDGGGEPCQNFPVGGPVVINTRLRLIDDADVRVRICHVVFDETGQWLTRLTSDAVLCSGGEGATTTVAGTLSPLYLPPGRYVISTSLHEANEPWNLVAAERYDLLSRSFSFSIEGQRTRRMPLTCLPAEWSVLDDPVMPGDAVAQEEGDGVPSPLAPSPLAS